MPICIQAHNAVRELVTQIEKAKRAADDSDDDKNILDSHTKEGADFTKEVLEQEKKIAKLEKQLEIEKIAR